MASSTAQPHFTPGKDPVPILQEAGWAPGPVWTGGKSRPQWDSIPDRPALSSVAIPTELPDPHIVYIISCVIVVKMLHNTLQDTFSVLVCPSRQGDDKIRKAIFNM